VYKSQNAVPLLLLQLYTELRVTEVDSCGEVPAAHARRKDAHTKHTHRNRHKRGDESRPSHVFCGTDTAVGVRAPSAQPCDSFRGL